MFHIGDLQLLLMLIEGMERVFGFYLGGGSQIMSWNQTFDSDYDDDEVTCNLLKTLRNPILILMSWNHRELRLKRGRSP